MQWKTDRVNEDILIRLKVLEEDGGQMNEAVFNTETYIYGQDDGIIYRKHRRNQLHWSEGVLFPSFRLPSEAEWEMLTEDNNVNQSRSFYPYGKDYFSLRWLTIYKKQDEGPSYYNYSIPNYKSYWRSNKPPENQQNRIHGPWSSEHPINLSGNVKEWLIDFYGDEKITQWSSTKEMLNRNGFNAEIKDDSTVYDEYGIINLKDYLGNFPFKIGATEMDGSAMWVKPPVPFSPLSYRYAVVDYNLGHDTLGIIYTFDEFFKTFNTKIYDYYFEKKLHGNGLNPNFLTSKFNHSSHYYTYSKLNQDSLRAIVRHFALEMWKSIHDDKSIGVVAHNHQMHACYKSKRGYFIRKGMTQAAPSFLPYNDSLRLVRGGDWKNPDFNARMAMRPDSAANNVGFRCVLPYTSMPVEKQYKVK